MSFAIIETGGKQYKVSASKILEIEKLNAKVGETVKFKNVLLLNDDKTTEIGSPSINGATVEAKASSIQVAYSMGGASIRLAEASVDNAKYQTTAAYDRDATTLSISLAF